MAGMGDRWEVWSSVSESHQPTPRHRNLEDSPRPATPLAEKAWRVFWGLNEDGKKRPDGWTRPSEEVEEVLLRDIPLLEARLLGAEIVDAHADDLRKLADS